MLFRFRDFELDPETYHLRRNGRDVDLRPKAFDLLAHLVRHRSRVVLRDELVRVVWGHTNVGAGSLSGLVNELRQALGEGAGREGSIRTVHARGYQFVAAVEELAGNRRGAIRVAAAGNRSLEPTEPLARVRDARFSAAVRDTLARVAAGGAAGVLVPHGEGAPDPQTDWRGLLDLAGREGFEIVRVRAPDVAHPSSMRFANDVVGALLVRRGRAALAEASPLPIRSWLDAAGREPVAGGVGARGPMPGGLPGLAALLSHLARSRPIVLAVDGLASAAPDFVRQLAAFVERLGKAPVLCAVPIEAVRDGEPGPRASVECESADPKGEGAEGESAFVRVLVASGRFVWLDLASPRPNGEVDASVDVPAGVSSAQPVEGATPLRAALRETLERFDVDEHAQVAQLLDRLCDAAGGDGGSLRPGPRRVEPTRNRRSRESG